MGILNKLKGRMSGYNALTKGPMKDHVAFDPTQDADFLREERQSKKVDLEKAKQMAESTQAKESGKRGSFWSSYATREERLKDKKKRQVGRAERKQIRKDYKEGKITKKQKRDKIETSRIKQKPTGKQKGDV